MKLHFAGKHGCVGRGCLECSALRGRRVTKGFQTFAQRTPWEQIGKGGPAQCKAADSPMELTPEQYPVNYFV